MSSPEVLLGLSPYEQEDDNGQDDSKHSSPGGRLLVSPVSAPPKRAAVSAHKNKHTGLAKASDWAGPKLACLSF